MPNTIPLTLEQALDRLPEEDAEGWYFELRKMRASDSTVQWLCAKTNWRTNKEACNNIGETPAEAVYKMLLRLGIVERYDARPAHDPDYDDVPF